MGILDKFEKICAIEHCSFDALKLRDYLVEFAKSYGYSVEIDEFDNIYFEVNGKLGFAHNFEIKKNNVVVATLKEQIFRFLPHFTMEENGE